ncbi:MAG: hypothetical protein PHW63_08985 [Alphaproteobacteria bacterium]|nr:hypothetical protein [Alphaproteobacteria bacterium]
MSSKYILTEKVLEHIAQHRALSEKSRVISQPAERDLHDAIADALEALLPEKTLDDLSPTERLFYLGTKVRLEGYQTEYLLLSIIGDEAALLYPGTQDRWPSIDVRDLNEIVPVSQ